MRKSESIRTILNLIKSRMSIDLDEAERLANSMYELYTVRSTLFTDEESDFLFQLLDMIEKRRFQEDDDFADFCMKSSQYENGFYY